MKTIQAGTYPVHIGEKAFTEMNKLLRSPGFRYGKLFLLADENTLAHCYPVLSEQSARVKEAKIIEVPSGEANKNIDVCSSIWKALSALGADRSSVLINLGGGVIGDMGGFAAATFKRGIPFIHVPTTLLSQVDASVGGKLGIDLNGLKNEVGLFSDPSAVFIHPVFLKTLPLREYYSGYAEVIKHALIADKKQWERIFASGLQTPFSDEMESIITHSVMIKNRIVRSDPRERGERKILNFGHTIGHAVESFSLEGGGVALLHGEAIAIGMICEAYLSVKKGGLGKTELSEITSFLLDTYRPVNNFDKFDDLRLVELMRHDKKNRGEGINFALLKRIGQAQYDKKCSVELIREALRYYREEAKMKS